MPIDLYILTTPHGIALSHGFALYLNNNLSGFAPIGADLRNASYPIYPIYLNASSNRTLGTSFVDFLSQRSDVQGVTYWSSEQMPFRWGEVIALSFVNQSLKERPVIVISWPSRFNWRDIDIGKMVPECLQLGQDLFDMVDSLEQNVAILASVDLAHTFQDTPFGTSPAAEPFDLACGKWAETLEGEYITVEAAALVNEALSCGYVGLVALHGTLERAAQVANKSMTDYWDSKLLANEHPTYYGMMVASFFPKVL